MIGLALLLAAAPPQYSQMHVQPTTEAEAVREFEATCVAGYHDLASLRQSVSSSKRGYVEQAVGSKASNWNSPFGVLRYSASMGTGSTRGPICALVSFTEARVDRQALAQALEEMARRHAISDYSESDENNIVTWSWIDARNRPVAVTMGLDRNTPQQITLMLRSKR